MLPVIIIGIDPGTRHLGWGVIRAEGTRLIHVAHGVIDTRPNSPLAERLVEIDDVLLTVTAEYKPEEGAVESLFFAKDPTAASKLGHARGVVLLRLARAGIPIFEYAATRVKRSVSGRGHADKAQVGQMVRALLGLAQLPKVDASDALAVAITHAQFARVDRALQAGRIPFDSSAKPPSVKSGPVARASDR